jgi:hypothetical protein
MRIVAMASAIAMAVALGVPGVLAMGGPGMGQHMGNQGGGSGGMHGGSGMMPAEKSGHGHEMAAVHGGMVFMTQQHHFEVVFGPDEIRVYPYDVRQAPISAKGIEGRIEVRRREGKAKTLKLEYREPGEMESRDYLAAAWSAEAFPPGETKVKVELEGLPGKESEATFTAPFDSLTAQKRYTCPMTQHTPQGMVDPGKCPQCGMMMQMMQQMMGGHGSGGMMKGSGMMGGHGNQGDAGQQGGGDHH